MLDREVYQRLKMRVSPQPRVSALLRIFAGTCGLFWLVGMAVCGMGRVCHCAGHEGACAVHASPVHKHDAVSPQEQGHSHDAGHHDDAEAHVPATISHHGHDGAAQDDHGCNGKQCGDERRCCSTIQALIVTPTPIIIAKPALRPALLISLLCAGRELSFAAPSTETLRQAKARDWVFTPEVCLGPAFRSLAPPVFI